MGVWGYGLLDEWGSRAQSKKKGLRKMLNKMTRSNAVFKYS
jgi:hypothetical protein